MDLEDRVLSIADAIGPDYIDLGPPDEAHFDPVTIGLMVAIWIAGAVGDGIHEGIKEASSAGTQAVLKAVTSRIQERLVPRQIRKAFRQPKTGSQLDMEMKAATQKLASAHDSTRALDEDTVGQIVTASASAVRRSLEASGLGGSGAERLQKSVEANINIVLRQPA